MDGLHKMRTNLIPVTVHNKMKFQRKRPLQIPLSTIAIFVTVGAFEMRQKHEGLKVTTLTRMAAPSAKNDDSCGDHCDC